MDGAAALGKANANLTAFRTGRIANVMDYGAKCDGMQDDTVAVALAWSLNDVIGIPAGRICCVKNLLYPHRTPHAGHRPRVGIVGMGGIATLRAFTGGDTSYLVASSVWAANGTYAAYPVLADQINFDGAGMVTDVFICQSFGAVFGVCDFTGGLGAGLRLTKTTKNGTALTGNMVNNVIYYCDIHDNGGAGLLVEDWATDTQLHGGYIFDNGGAGIAAERSAGFQIEQVHTYANGGGGAYLSKWGMGSAAVNNYFEDAVVVHSIQNRNAIFGGFNTFLSKLQYDGAEGGVGNRTFTSKDNHFGPLATLVQNFNFGDRTILSDGDVFEGARPFEWNGASLSAGNIVAKMCPSITTDNQIGGVFYDGLIPPNDVGAIAPNYFDVTKRLTAASTTTTFTVAATVKNYTTAGLSLKASLDVHMTSAAGVVDTLTAEITAQYGRVVNTTTTTKTANILQQNSSGGGISIAVGIVDTSTNAAGDNVVTLTITITHPTTGSAVQSNAAILKLRSTNRSVRYLTVS